MLSKSGIRRPATRSPVVSSRFSRPARPFPVAGQGPSGPDEDSFSRLEETAKFGFRLGPPPSPAETHSGGPPQAAPVVQRRRIVRDGRIVEVPDHEPVQPFVPFAGRGFRLDGGPVAPAPAPAPVPVPVPAPAPAIAAAAAAPVAAAAGAGPNLQGLPDSMLHHSASFLSMADRGSLAGSSRAMRDRVNEVNQVDQAARDGVLEASLAGQMNFQQFMHHPVNQALPGSFTIGDPDSDEDNDGG